MKETHFCDFLVPRLSEINREGAVAVSFLSTQYRNCAWSAESGSKAKSDPAGVKRDIHPKVSLEKETYPGVRSGPSNTSAIPTPAANEGLRFLQLQLGGQEGSV
jgi:hypothetical protein